MNELKNITTFIFDVDGVMTDGKIYAFDNGEQVRAFNIKDGWAIVFAQKAGYNVAIISSGQHEGVRKRLEYLGVKNIHLAVKNKVETYESLVKELGVSNEEVLYMGDDIADYKVMPLVGVSACPADAVTDILNTAAYISPKNGGEGCVREIIEKTLRIQGKWVF